MLIDIVKGISMNRYAKLRVYKIPQVINLVISTPGKRLNPAMNYSEAKVVKGIDNEIHFQIRDTDRKPINLLGKQIIGTMYFSEDQKFVLETPFIIDNASKGMVSLQLSASLINSWPTGRFYLAIKMIDGEGKQEIAYSSYDYDTKVELIVSGDTFPGPLRSSHSTDHFVSMVADIGDNYTISDPLPGDLIDRTGNGLHSSVFWSENFAGKVTLQGTLVTNTSIIEHDWFTIKEFQFDGEYTGSTIHNYEHSTGWTRLKIEPTQVGPAAGTITKFTTRN